MAYVITDACIKDELCIEVCPVDCIHPRSDEEGFAEVPQLYIDPDECIDCGACVPVCTSDAIFLVEDLPSDQAHFAERNAAYFAQK